MVYEILNHGAENAQSATDLCKVLGVQRRELVAAAKGRASKASYSSKAVKVRKSK